MLERCLECEARMTNNCFRHGMWCDLCHGTNSYPACEKEYERV